MEMYLCCFTSSNPNKWATWLPWVKFCYNTSFHVATKRCPFEILYGQLPPTILSYVPRRATTASVKDLLLQKDGLLQDVRQ